MKIKSLLIGLVAALLPLGAFAQGTPTSIYTTNGLGTFPSTVRVGKVTVGVDTNQVSFWSSFLSGYTSPPTNAVSDARYILKAGHNSGAQAIDGSLTLSNIFIQPLPSGFFTNQFGSAGVLYNRLISDQTTVFNPGDGNSKVLTFEDDGGTVWGSMGYLSGTEPGFWMWGGDGAVGAAMRLTSGFFKITANGPGAGGARIEGYGDSNDELNNMFVIRSENNLSQLKIEGGIEYTGQVETGTNYTMNCFEYLLMVRGTTAPAITNTLSRTFDNLLTRKGKSHIIVDAQGAAATTNIVVKSQDGTINNAATYTINQNYGGALFTFDSTRTNWIASPFSSPTPAGGNASTNTAGGQFWEQSQTNIFNGWTLMGGGSFDPTNGTLQVRGVSTSEIASTVFGAPGATFAQWTLGTNGSATTARFYALVSGGNAALMPPTGGDLLLRTGSGATVATSASSGAFNVANTLNVGASPTNVINELVIRVLDRIQIQAPDFDTPNNSDWATNSAAALSPGVTNAALSMLQFNDTTEQGGGFSTFVPVGASTVTFNFLSRAQTATNTAVNVQPFIFTRNITTSPVPAWSTNIFVTAIPVNTNGSWTYSSQTFALSTLGWTTGQVSQAEITRRGAHANDTLIGNWLLNQVTLEFR